MIRDMQRYPLKLFFKDYYVSIGVAGAFLADLFLWIYLPFRVRNLGELVFLHYTIHFGVDFIGLRTRLFFLPAFGFIIIILHTGLGYWLYGQFKELARFLLISQTILCGLLILSVMALLIIN